MTFNLTKVCPFLDKTCIGMDCPSFTCETHQTKNFVDYISVTKRKGLFKKKHRAEYGLEIGSTIYVSPICQVLGNKVSLRHSYLPTGVSVGETNEEIIKLDKPKWTRINWWTSDFIEVKALPDIDAWLKTIPEKVSELGENYE